MADRTESAPPSEAAASLDAGSSIRSKAYRRLLVLAAGLGVVVSVACWAFLELIHAIQEWVYVDLPDAVGFASPPWWWPLPVLVLAGAIIGVAIDRLPGTGGHEPSEGLTTGAPTTPLELPGVVLAAIASIALGMVLGPEGPLIALGSGLTLLLLGLARTKVPDQATLVLVAAASFAALGTIFGSPIVGAIVIIEAAGLGGPTLPLVLLPGLIAAGIGSLVFVGVGSLTGLSSASYAMVPISLPSYPDPNAGDFLWTVALAAVGAVVTFAIVRAGRRVAAIVERRRIGFTIVAGVAVAVIAIAFGEISDLGAFPVLFSGQEALNPTVSDGPSLSLGVLVLLLACKSVAWAISLGSARGGPTFPAIFLGVVGGLLASHLPGFAETPAVAVLVGASVVAVLKLPLSAVVIALLVTQGGAGVAPLVIVGVAVAYLVIQMLDARIPSATQPGEGGAAATPAGPDVAPRP